MIRPETMLESWKAVRQDTAQAVEDFPTADLDYKPVEGSDDFSRDRASHSGGRPCSFFEQVITRFDGQRVTRLEMVQFAKRPRIDSSLPTLRLSPLERSGSVHYAPPHGKTAEGLTDSKSSAVLVARNSDSGNKTSAIT